MNYSANDLTLDARTQNSLYSKNNFQIEDENDQIVHQVPQGSFEGVHGVNEDYEEEFDHDDDQEEQEEFDQEYDQDKQQYDQEQEVAYFPDQQQLEEDQDEHDNHDYPKVDK